MARNLRLKLIKVEASKNPIETLENEYHRRLQDLEARAQRIKTLAAKTENFGSQLGEFKQRWPKNAEKYQRVYDKMMILVENSRRQWKKGQQALEGFEGQIEEAKAEWAMAASADGLQKDAGKVEQEFLAKIRTSAAFESVQTGMNMAIASVDQLLMEAESGEINVTATGETQAALPAPDQRLTIDTTTTKTSTKVSR